MPSRRLFSISSWQCGPKCLMLHTVKLQIVSEVKFALQDPNQKVAMFESSDIIRYLDETYAAA